jgi:hypothetical protein
MEMDVESSDLEHTHRVEATAMQSFDGLIVDYHKRMAEAMIHALANWVHEEDVEDIISDILFCRGKIEVEVGGDAQRSRYK